MGGVCPIYDRTYLVMILWTPVARMSVDAASERLSDARAANSPEIPAVIASPVAPDLVGLSCCRDWKKIKILKSKRGV